MRHLTSFCTSCLMGFVAIYRYMISPIIVGIFGARCRFYPSCSQYAMESLKKDPPIRACKKIMCRLLKCHPFHPGGVDEP